MNKTPVLKCENLCKAYKPGKPVLENFNLTIEPGRIVGLLGPNGCGKSTFLKLVSGLLVPDSGRIEICSEERSDQTNAYISFLPERTYFDNSSRVHELISLFADFYTDFDKEAAIKMLNDLHIPLEAKLKTLSKGMKEKVQLIMVMSRKTKLYLLDEPIGGVDPASREYILNTIITNYNPEASIIITTHLIADIEPILDDFAFMTYGGKIIREGNADTVREETGKTLDELFREVFRC